VTWHQQLQLLELILKVFPQSGPILLPQQKDNSQLRRVLEESERQNRAGVDAAVRAFANSGQWPSLQGNERYFLCQRIEFAILLTCAMGTPHNSGENPFVPNLPSTVEKEDQVEWLLNAVWIPSGRGWWLEKAILNTLAAQKKT
jgi:hypothetical protein